MAKNLQMATLLDFYGNMLTDKQRDMIELYYEEDLSLAEIAENCGISRQGVRDSIKRGEAFLLEMEEKLCFVQKFAGLYQAMDKIGECAKTISEINRIRTLNKEIDSNAYQILKLTEDIDQL